jgi:Flp pilus assembly protein CpaB
MEIEYEDNGRRRKIVMILGVVLALAAGASAFFLINQAQQQASLAGRATVSIVVAERAIPARKPIEADDVALRDVPVDDTNAQGVVTSPDQVIGRVSSVTILQGQLVTTNLLASTTTGGQFSILGPTETVTPESEAWRAVSLTVSDDRAVGGLIEPNQTVDVFVSATVNVPQAMLDTGRYYTDKSTKIVYQNMVVLAKAGTQYVVRAPLAVAEEIAHLQASGTAQFSMALRPEEDVRSVDVTDLGATTNELIERYGLPVPETYPQGRSRPASINP